MIIVEEQYPWNTGGGGGVGTIDSTLSGSSTNAVQNRVVTAALAQKANIVPGASGANSFVAGYDNKALGDYSVAVGAHNTAVETASVVTGINCINPFHSIATNYDPDGFSQLPDNDVVMHSGKLSVSLFRDNVPLSYTLMDFTNLMFTGVLHLQGLYITCANDVYTLDATVHIVNNEIVGTKINSYSENGNFNDSPTSSSSWPLFDLQNPLEITNRELRHTNNFYSNCITYAQVGVDYTCIALEPYESYYYGGAY